MYTPITINTTDDSAPLVAQVQLEGQAYQLYFRYNVRAGFWRCDVQDQSGNALAAGLAVRNFGIPFNLALYLHNNLPPGLLYAIASANPGVDAGENEIGARVQLWYRTAVG